MTTPNALRLAAPDPPPRGGRFAPAPRLGRDQACNVPPSFLGEFLTKSALGLPKGPLDPPIRLAPDQPSPPHGAGATKPTMFHSD